MRPVWFIAADEWRYWLRSHFALGSTLIFLVLVVVTSVFTAAHIDAEKHNRTQHQSEAEETFLAQPDRHPHRMVHYGHYLFRAPAPMAMFDSGIDYVTGQSIFLEGHRQNTVMFAESSASADLGGFSWLTPAFVYQLFAPLIIILLGHGSLVREYEANLLAPLLAQGVKGYELILGKVLALLSFSLVLLVPLILNCLTAITHGESFTALWFVLGTYFLYLAVWVLLALFVSMALRARATVLAAMLGFWLVICLVLPSIAVNLATNAAPVAGKIETDLTMLTDLRKLGDGHNANDPAFKKLRADLLAKYNVAGVEQLPINFRGVVAVQAEKKLTTVLNDYAESRMVSEARQEKVMVNFGWLSPAMAIAAASRALTGTDLEHYHRFQIEAEAVRFAFVQGLNQAHVESLSYQDDINRNKDEASWLRARVDADNWKVLETFKFEVADVPERLEYASYSILHLLWWLLVLLVLLFWRGSKIKP